MKQEDIKTKMEGLQTTLVGIVTQGTFLHDTRFKEIVEEMKYLKSICEHTYENGECIYCRKEYNEKV